MKILNQILKEDPFKTFLPKHFTKLPYSCADNALEFINFLNWDVVKKVIEQRKSMVRIVNSSALIKEGPGH